MEPDTSNFAITAVLSQWYAEENGTHLHLIAFRSRRLFLIEYNYNIGNRELQIIMDTFRDWCLMLYSTQAPVKILSDHTNLIIFTKN